MIIFNSELLSDSDYSILSAKLLRNVDLQYFRWKIIL